VKVPVLEVGGQTAKSDKASIGYRLQSTPEARFNALFAQLESEGAITEFPFFEPETWNGLSTGEVLVIAVNLRLFSLDRIAMQMESVKGLGALASDLVPAARALGLDGVEQVERMANVLAELGSASAQSKLLSVVGEVRDSPRYRVVARLKRSGMRCEPLMLEQECRLVGYLDRRTTRAEERVAVSPLVLEGSAGGSRSVKKSRGPARVPAGSRPQQPNADAPAEDAYAKHPAALLTPIAIFP
jgi:hypothetical protein